VSTKIHYNGQPREVPAGTTVAALLEHLELRPSFVAVEINMELVPRGKHAAHLLKEGDQVEVVTLVGGG
jgi:sulfur carrier protein